MEKMGKVKRGYKRWTQEEISQMKQLYHDGIDMSEIGRQLNRNKNSVNSKLVALKIHKVEKVEKVYLWDVESVRGNIIDEQEAKQTTHQSNNEMLFKCSSEDCDTTKMMRVQHLVNNGYSCPTCSIGTSYGQLAFHSYQTHFKLEYEAEVVLKTLNNRRVDFVKFDDKGNVINFVEIQGIQHTD